MIEAPEDPTDLPSAQQRQGPPLTEPVDRRRPGRPKDIRPSLIPLLRFKPSPAQVDALQHREETRVDATWGEDDDDLRASRGILFGVVVSGLIWAVIVALMIWFS